MKLDEILRHGGYRRGWGATGGLLVCALCALSFSARADAGAITVTTTVDQLDGAAPCSLREAVDTANQDVNTGGCTDPNPAAADTIKLDGGDYNLQRAGAEDANASGDLDVTESLTIVGAGADVTGIDGNAAITGDRVLDVTAGTLTISGLNVHDGSATGTFGGGIKAASGVALKVTDSAVRSNDATTGGGIYAYGATATITRTTVSGNDAGACSAVYATTLTLSNSTASENHDNSAGLGAAAVCAAGTATIANSTISGNEGTFGGGVFAGTAKLTGSTVTGNVAEGTGTSPAGGGIYATTVKLTNSTVSGNAATGGNTASSGGGINAGTATLTDSTVTGNVARGPDPSTGGGIAAFTATLTRSTVSDNSATGRGGAIYGAGTLTDSSVRRNSSGAEGGGIYTDAGTLTVNRSTISDNDATNNAGGIFFTSPGALNITNSTLSGNESNGWGGALSTDEGTTNFKNATISRNVADADADGSGDGGGIDGFGGTVNLRNTILAGNLDLSAPEHPDWHCDLGGVVSQGYNLLSSTAGCAVAPATGDQTASDPGLAFLANNGGRTLTLAPLSNSPAVNSGNPATSGSGACPATDQRGVPRSLGGRCDKGAYERVSCQGRLVNLVGTGGADVLVGTAAADGIVGLGGSDILRGGGGGDGLCGQEGNDQLFGEAGNDFLDGGADTDTCDGGTEADQAVGCETITLIP